MAVQPSHSPISRRSPRALRWTPSGQRQRQEQQSRDRHARADALDRRERAVTQARGGHREHADPACGDALHERQRRQPQRGDVQEESAGLHCERREPDAIRQQQAQRARRSQQRQRRKLANRVVLAHVGEVHERRRDERQREPDGGLDVGVPDEGDRLHAHTEPLSRKPRRSPRARPPEAQHWSAVRTRRAGTWLRLVFPVVAVTALVLALASPSPTARVSNVRRYGAVGNDRNNDNPGVQSSDRGRQPRWWWGGGGARRHVSGGRFHPHAQQRDAASGSGLHAGGRQVRVRPARAEPVCPLPGHRTQPLPRRDDLGRGPQEHRVRGLRHTRRRRQPVDGTADQRTGGQAHLPGRLSRADHLWHHHQTRRPLRDPHE